MHGVNVPGRRTAHNLSPSLLTRKIFKAMPKWRELERRPVNARFFERLDETELAQPEPAEGLMSYHPEPDPYIEPPGITRSWAVDVATMGYPSDDHKLLSVVYRVDNPVVTDADPKVVTTGKLYRARRSRIDRQIVDRRLNAFSEGSTESAVCLDRLRVKAELVVLARCYLRTFDQGTAWSASSRACSAARLSSRNSARSTSSL